MKHVWQCRRTFIALVALGVICFRPEAAMAVGAIAAALAGANSAQAILAKQGGIK